MLDPQNFILRFTIIYDRLCLYFTLSYIQVVYDRFCHTEYQENFYLIKNLFWSTIIVDEKKTATYIDLFY